MDDTADDSRSVSGSPGAATSPEDPARHTNTGGSRSPEAPRTTKATKTAKSLKGARTAKAPEDGEAQEPGRRRAAGTGAERTDSGNTDAGNSGSEGTGPGGTETGGHGRVDHDTGGSREEVSRAGVAVSAEEFGLDGPRGPVFSHIAFDAAPGSLIALEGPSGSGRTCLLLSLTGRMKATSGHALVDGRRLPQQLAAVRRISALAAVPGVTDLEPSLSVAEHLRERVLLQQRFGGSLRSLLRPGSERRAGSRARVSAALNAAGLDLSSLAKGPRTRVRDLERLEALRLSVALGLLGRPRLLAVDDVDFKLSESEREQAWSLLRSVSSSGVTVLAVCSEAPEDAVVVRTAAAPESQKTREAPRTRQGERRPGSSERPDATSDEEAGDALAETGRA